MACNVQLAQHGETHSYFILARGKNQAIDRTLFLPLQATQALKYASRRKDQKGKVSNDGTLDVFK